MKVKKNKKQLADISNTVMDTIEKEHISMRPKAYFIAGSALLGIGSALSFFVAIMLFTIIVFHLRTSGSFEFLQFGRLGIRPMFVTFPFGLLFLSMGSLFVGSMLLKRYDFSYKKSFVGIVIGLIASIITFGFILDKLGLNDRLLKVNQFRPIYTERMMDKDFVKGKITHINKDIFTINTNSEREVNVQVTKKTRLPLRSDFEEGQVIRAVGEWDGDTFIAKGIMQGKFLLHKKAENVRGKMHEMKFK
ncbi:hypothetical protein ACFL1P_00710 [Patescibacteria group bacterium]